MVLKVSSSCWTNMIGKSSSTVLLKFANNELLKMLRNPNFCLMRGPWRFWSCRRDLDRLKLASKSYEDIDWNENGRAASREWTLRMLACYGEFLKGFVSGEFSVWVLKNIFRLAIRHLYCWTVEMMLQMTGLQFKKDRLLKLSFFARFNIFCKFFLTFSVNFSWPKRIVWNYPSCRTWRLWENLSPLTSYRVTSSVSEPSQRNFVGRTL